MGRWWFFENNPLKLISALFKYLDTNLVIGDRIRLAFFSLRTRNSKRVNIDLKDTSYLKKEELVSGEEGFIKTETVPNEMVIIFSEPNIAKKNLKAIIYNTTSQNQTAEEIGEILELIGVKVASILKKDEEIETDCLIYSKDNDVEEIFAKLFACEISEKPMENKFDIEIKLGKKFADRF